MYARISLIIFCTGFAVTSAQEVPAAITKLGVIKGKSNVHKFRGKEYTTHQFFGIPYAKPPVGHLRFQRPELHDGFPLPLEATTFGSACPQNDVFNFGKSSRNEDCLFLNIYVPTTQKDSSKGYAVMIFIHGGGFSLGAGDLLHGETLCAYGNVILVTINYRLGIFGFANTGDEKAKGNMGLWDQRLAIQWVNDNIGAFGGDSSRITIFGESAGSISVFMQGMFPKNKGLFQNLIAESGTPTMFFGFRDNNVPALTYVAKMLDCPTETIESIYRCLKDASVDSILNEIMKITSFEDQLKLRFWPSFDGEYFLRSPSDTLQQSRENPTEEIKFLRSINIINGMNDAEGAMWIPFIFHDIDNYDSFVLTHDDFKNGQISNLLKTVTMGEPVPELLLSVVSSAYRDWSNPSNARNMFVKLMGDYYFNVPGVELSMSHANDSSSKSWVYSFRAQLGLRLLAAPSWVVGANHGDELLPVFGFSLSDYGTVANNTEYIPQEWELDLAESVMNFWTNFAKDGNPGPDWPQYDVESQKFLAINRQNSVQQYLYAREVNFWREIVPEILLGVHTHSSSPFSLKLSDTCEKEGNCG